MAQSKQQENLKNRSSSEKSHAGKTDTAKTAAAPKSGKSETQTKR